MVQKQYWTREVRWLGGRRRRGRNWVTAHIGPNSHPRKVRRWMRATGIGIGSATGNWPEDFLRKAAARHKRREEHEST